ncbi:anti-phage dCTP deaminase [Falsiroseomonas sp. HC035]|uniref:anti-phage dCTP deaminase n=1 Tax=Falsiroseomonas sp. HC035 TaxID=3390999 RepID=UPI003D3238A8
MQRRPELVFALVGAVGTDLKRVGELLTHELSKVSYSCEKIRLSDLLLECWRFGALRDRKSSLADDDRINRLMDAGDEFRSVSQRGDAVALLAMTKMMNSRPDRDSPRHNHAFLLHSLKHPQELETLRAAYGDALVVVSVYMPRAERRLVLAKRIAQTRKAYGHEAYMNVASDLIDRDEKESGEKFGQNVRDTFPEADFFLDASDTKTLTLQVERLIQILFHHPHRTPTPDEYFLFHAKATALRSADLARQVGAVIATADGEIISAGCNEVPKAGGGAVWEDLGGNTNDRRDFHIGHDPTARMKHVILTEVFDRLKTGGWLSESFTCQAPEDLATEALVGRKTLAGTRVASIIEFGRIVHAEMSAITDAARRGLAVKNAKLYCTTFPCHMCARHIIASGISEVIYIEPYPKSMARDLYEGMLRVDHDEEEDEGAVHFRPFVGTAPRRYLAFFEMPERKDAQGHVIEWASTVASPRVKQFSAFLQIEKGHVLELARNSREWGVEEGGESNE